ncbi:hypothetical protein SUGI_0104080 [Cryptomeria japonica]|nr:hypothetical protein SUGI_0104080 [Cryptomeria japonica]
MLHVICLFTSLMEALTMVDYHHFFTSRQSINTFESPLIFMPPVIHNFVSRDNQQGNTHHFCPSYPYLFSFCTTKITESLLVSIHNVFGGVGYGGCRLHRSKHSNISSHALSAWCSNEEQRSTSELCHDDHSEDFGPMNMFRDKKCKEIEICVDDPVYGNIQR